ncbi:MAG: acyl-ACP--UDP-N-acetylglucosamine O-acyltransferase [bacterium]|nr:acyl-ACP--UDP-N-acetylglucosamine O-acyltransferase [bacterium]
MPSRPNIHPTASVHPTAVLGKDVIVGPYSIVGEEVFIGDRTTIEAHVMIDKWTQIGEDNHIHFGAVIGSPGQDTKYSGEKAYVSIGDRNELREYVTINRATGKDQVTRLGNDNMLMTNTHLGHNCNVGSNIIMANMVHVAGHVTIEDYAIIGGLTGVHQFVRIGKGCMIGGYSGLAQDVPPFMTCDGNPAYVRGINAIGIKRRGGDSSTVKELKEAYKLLYRSDVTHKEAIARIEKESNSDTLAHLVAFLKQDTSRGISKKREKVADEE